MTIRKMDRQTLTRHLRKMEDVAIPKGHARFHKGITTYFFSIERRPEIEALLMRQGLSDHGPAPNYVQETIYWHDDDRSHLVLLHHIEPEWFSVAIFTW